MNAKPQRVLNLSGSWRVALDPFDQGQAAHWYKPESTPPTASCNLPGSIQAQGFGDDITPDTPWTADRNGNNLFDTDPKYAAYRVAGNVKFPYWLQPLKYYAGAAWFFREVEVPQDWQGTNISLHLERAHWQTTVWVDGLPAGPASDSLSTPHEHDLTRLLSPGRHTLAMRVDNRIHYPVGPNAHSVSDHTQGNWNGVIGTIELHSRPDIRLKNISIQSDLAANVLHLTATIAAAAPGNGRVECRGVSTSVYWSSEAQVRLEIPCQHLPRWSEHAPELVETEVCLLDTAGRALDVQTVRHGIRQIATRGTRILVNDVPTLLRGTLECCIFPRTGYPPADVAAWKRVMTIAKRHGLNHLRFHSWCPPEAAFVAADEVGVYLQVECATWPNQGASIGDGGAIDAWLYAEAHRIIDAYGHHPSFVMLACGNEPAGEHHVAFLDQWIAFWKANDPQRLHTGGSGWPDNHGSDFHVRFQPRIQHWGAGLTSSINAQDLDSTTDYRSQIDAFDRPTVTHEIGQWCVYPDLAAIKKYNGALRATSFEIVADSLRANHLTEFARDFLLASGKLQALVYKEEIEAQFRTPGLGGFQLLDLHDFPGQGTALVGVLDAFWDSKGYIEADDFRRFCGPTVLLARMSKRVWATSDRFEAEIDLAYFLPDAIGLGQVDWRVETTEGESLATGTFKSVPIEVGKLNRIGRVALPLRDVAAPQSLRLIVKAPGIAPVNDWNFWVYPSIVADPPGVLVTDVIDPSFHDAIAAGRPILFCPSAEAIASPVALGFSPIFWNTLFTNGQAPHTLGLLIDSAHPAFRRFPTSFHSDWQWQEPLRHAACLMLDRLGSKRPERPMIRVIDDWNENRSLGLLFEIRIGRSRVIVSGINLVGELSTRPASRQLRHALVNDLLARPMNDTIHEMTVEELVPLLGKTVGAALLREANASSSYGRQ
jgi:hypothetical protein